MCVCVCVLLELVYPFYLIFVWFMAGWGFFFALVIPYSLFFLLVFSPLCSYVCTYEGIDLCMMMEMEMDNTIANCCGYGDNICPQRTLVWNTSRRRCLV